MSTTMDRWLKAVGSFTPDPNDTLPALPEGTEDLLQVLPEEERARLHEDLRASMVELERGDIFPIEQVLAELRDP